MHAKIRVNGKQAHPLYQYQTDRDFLGVIKWNFTKFLVNREGKVIQRFSPKTGFQDIETSIRQQLMYAQRFKAANLPLRFSAMLKLCMHTTL